jgi:hypothetical protein
VSYNPGKDAFERLEELLAMLDEMREKDAALVKAYKARELCNLAKHAQRLEDELKGYEAIRDKALHDAKIANVCGDKENESKALALLRMYSDLYALRLAPQQRAKEALAAALAESPLSLSDPLDELAMDDDSFSALEESVNAYREEYLACYELCKSLEGSN